MKHLGLFYSFQLVMEEIIKTTNRERIKDGLIVFVPFYVSNFFWLPVFLHQVTRLPL
jgi:hypothetical protein